MVSVMGSALKKLQLSVGAGNEHFSMKKLKSIVGGLMPKPTESFQGRP